jgi:hypothetical protein
LIDELLTYDDEETTNSEVQIVVNGHRYRFTSGSATSGEIPDNVTILLDAEELKQ